MASPGGPPPGGAPFNQQQIQQLIAMEAQKRGMTIPQFQAFQRQQIETEAAKAGMTPQQFVQMKQEEARQQFMRQQQAMQQAQQQQQAQGQGQTQQQQPRPGGPPPGQQVQHIPLNANVEAKPEALAVAKFLRGQDLKTRTCIFNGERKDMFKVKRAFRALQSDAYKKAQKKNPLLPKVENDVEARQALQLLPLSMLALRVSKKDPHEGHNHAKPKKEKRVKGLWEVKIEQQQDFDPMMHYVWLFEGSQWKTKLWAGLALIAVFAVVLFPLWPLKLRLGVWYLSVGLMGLIALFFAMAIFRLILFVITFFLAPPGLWLYPNLFEDVGFFDSFRPLWGWHETKEDIKRKKKEKKARKAQKKLAEAAAAGGEKNQTAPAVVALPPPSNGAAVTSGAEPGVAATAAKRHIAPTVEEADDE
ncbi:Translocation protein sec62 [Cladophialophora carrionii]|uniref:Translocation protein SEC62 n=1 Tax=Cladophialophora carrionii TaxID=86049 RepID=A0A1C1CY18_9EURO|nr:Translocation protein sec62 [Cladophialophora carrionii]